MYECFTDRARKVMVLANEEAKRFSHEYIGTEHILLGLVKEAYGVAANVLKNLDIDLRKVRLEVEKIVQPGPPMVTMGKLPQTPRAKKVIEYSIEEARNLGHNYVGTEHLLLGLAEQEGVAAVVLTFFGLNADRIRHEVRNLLGMNMQLSPDNSDATWQTKLNAVHGVVEELNRSEAAESPKREPLKPEPPPVGLSAETEARIRTMERQLATVRLLLGTVFGTGAGVLIGDRLGAVVGLLVGGGVALFGRLIPALLAGGIAGGCIASTHFGDETGTVAGAVVGALLAACVAEVGRPRSTDPTPPKSPL